MCSSGVPYETACQGPLIAIESRLVIASDLPGKPTNLRRNAVARVAQSNSATANDTVNVKITFQSLESREIYLTAPTSNDTYDRPSNATSHHIPTPSPQPRQPRHPRSSLSGGAAARRSQSPNWNDGVRAVQRCEDGVEWRRGHEERDERCWAGSDWGKRITGWWIEKWGDGGNCSRTRTEVTC